MRRRFARYGGGLARGFYPFIMADGLSMSIKCPMLSPREIQVKSNNRCSFRGWQIVNEAEVLAM